MTENSFSIFELLIQFGISIVVVVFSFILVEVQKDINRKKDICILGIVILKALRENLRSSLKEITKNIQNEKDKGGTIFHYPEMNLPRNAWYGIQTINDDVMIRIATILEKNKEIKIPKMEYEIIDVRIHCMHCFEHIFENLRNGCIESQIEKYKKNILDVDILLETIIKILEENRAKKIFVV